MTELYRGSISGETPYYLTLLADDYCCSTPDETSSDSDCDSSKGELPIQLQPHPGVSLPFACQTFILRNSQQWNLHLSTNLCLSVRGVSVQDFEAERVRVTLFKFYVHAFKVHERKSSCVLPCSQRLEVRNDPPPALGSLRTSIYVC